MKTLRRTRSVALALLAVCASASGLYAQVRLNAPSVQRQSPPVQRPPMPSPQRQPGPVPQGGPVRGEHLAQWMSKHQNLTPQQQQDALRKEPGFQQLPSETQSRVMGRLGQLNAMPAQRRERVINRAEAMERLQPQQRQQVRGALGQLGMLPVDRRQMVARAFRDIRRLPPEQRQGALNSPAYQHFTPQERSTLNNLMQVEPMLPAQP